jgi:hypothetical protein
MNNIIEPEVFDMFNKYSNYVVFWLVFFSILTLIQLTYDMYFNEDNPFDINKKLEENKENLILSELPGITFLLLHSVCWYTSKNVSSKLFFLYWGPLFFVTAYFVLFKKDTDWKKIAFTSSVMCKAFYVIFVGIFWYLGYMMPIYCYSLWIMSDQVRLAWWKNNGDRSRRLFEDYFIPRIGYPLFLLLPFFDQTFYYRNFFMGVSSTLLIAWLAGLYRLVQNGTFFDQPKIEGFGRDIVYL